MLMKTLALDRLLIMDHVLIALTISTYQESSKFVMILYAFLIQLFVDVDASTSRL